MRRRDIARGARIEYRLGTEPSAWGTRAQDALPSMNGGTRVETRGLSGRLAPAQAFVLPSAQEPSQARFKLELVATTPRSARIDVTASAPPGFSVEPRSARADVDSGGLPATRCRSP